MGNFANFYGRLMWRLRYVGLALLAASLVGGMAKSGWHGWNDFLERIPYALGAFLIAVAIGTPVVALGCLYEGLKRNGMRWRDYLDLPSEAAASVHSKILRQT